MEIKVGLTFKSKNYDDIIQTIVDVIDDNVVINYFDIFQYQDDGSTVFNIYNYPLVMDEYKRNLEVNGRFVNGACDCYKVSVETIKAGFETGFYYLYKVNTDEKSTKKVQKSK